MPCIAVFTKNRTNPAYEAARLGADRTAARLGATVAHYVPERPDSVPEQATLIAQAIAARPDAAVFVPVDETAVNDAVLGFDAAQNSAVQHHHPHHSRPPGRVRRLGRPGPGTKHRAPSVRQAAAARHHHHPRRHARVRDGPRAPPGLSGRTGQAPGHQCALLAARRLPARHRSRGLSSRPRPMAGRRCGAVRQRRDGARRAGCARGGRGQRTAARWPASTRSPRRSRPSPRDECWPRPTSTPWR